MNSVRLPLFVKYGFYKGEESLPRMTIGLAPYVEYFFFTQQQYKITTTKFKEKVQLDNPVQGGIAMEISAYRKHKKGVSIPMGGQYQILPLRCCQITDYLKNNACKFLCFKNARVN